tara:strand:+ start:152 stop:490 length:339 start_codon:yes stop_codon:yes gene_type:complete
MRVEELKALQGNLEKNVEASEHQDRVKKGQEVRSSIMSLVSPELAPMIQGMSQEDLINLQSQLSKMLMHNIKSLTQSREDRLFAQKPAEKLPKNVEESEVMKNELREMLIKK